jgi:hypothetical protein
MRKPTDLKIYIFTADSYTNRASASAIEIDDLISKSFNAFERSFGFQSIYVWRDFYEDAIKKGTIRDLGISYPAIIFADAADNKPLSKLEKNAINGYQIKNVFSAIEKGIEEGTGNSIPNSEKYPNIPIPVPALGNKNICNDFPIFCEALDSLKNFFGDNLLPNFLKAIVVLAGIAAVTTENKKKQVVFGVLAAGSLAFSLKKDASAKVGSIGKTKFNTREEVENSRKEALLSKHAYDKRRKAYLKEGKIMPLDDIKIESYYDFFNPYSQNPSKNHYGKTRLSFLKGKPGVYLIKENEKLTYVGYAGTDLYRTVLRHFANWDNGEVTYKKSVNRKSYEVAIYVTKDERSAWDLEKYIIDIEKPRDNTELYDRYTNVKYNPDTLSRMKLKKMKLIEDVPF